MISAKQALDRERVSYSGQKITLRSAHITEDCTFIVFRVDGESEGNLGRSWQIRGAVYATDETGRVLAKTGIIIASGFDK